MKTSQAGIDLIKSFEGFRSAPYRDAVGIPTIGYGMTIYPDGRTVKTMDPEKQADVISEETAGQLTSAMRDVVKPVTLPFTLVITGSEAHMTGAVTINRTEWGVGQGQYAGGDPVATDVKISVDLIATAQ